MGPPNIPDGGGAGSWYAVADVEEVNVIIADVGDLCCPSPALPDGPEAPTDAGGAVSAPRERVAEHEEGEKATEAQGAAPVEVDELAEERDVEEAERVRVEALHVDKAPRT